MPGSLAALFTKLAGVSGATAVGLGAFGAHALKKSVTDPALLAVWTTASHYHLIHSVALMGVASYALHSAHQITRRTPAPAAASATARAVVPSDDNARRRKQITALKVSGYSFLAGNVLFSGSLYGMVLTGVKGLGAVTPFGGLAYIIGWCALGYAGVYLAPPPPSPAALSSDSNAPKSE